MAVDLSAEVKRVKIADTLTNGDDDSDSESDSSTDETDSTDTEAAAEPTPSDAPAQPAPTPSRAEAGLVSLGDYSAAASPTPSPPTRYPTIAEDQTGAPVERAQPITYPTIAEDQTGAPVVPSAAVQPAQPETAPSVAQPETPAGHIDLGPPGRNIYTAADTGARYVIDPITGQMVPHGELATAADKAAQPPGTDLPRVVVPGADIREEGLPVPQDQVRRAQLVKLPPTVEKGIALPPKVQPAQPVTYPTISDEAISPRALALPGERPAALQAPATARPAVPPPVQGASARQASGLVSLGDYSQPKVATQPTAAQPPVTGALAQGPPGTHPAGTEDEPYWPKSAQQISQLPPGSRYVDPQDGSVKTAAGQPSAAAKAAAPGQVSAELQPNGSNFPDRVQAVGGNAPAAFISHHTGGRGTVQGVLDTLHERGLGVEYVMDRDGNIFQTGGPGAQNILPGWGPKGTGLNNQNVVGMEIIAKDDKDVTPAQAQSFARFIATRYPDTPLFGHGEVNPGHKEADEGLTAKAAAMALRTSGQPGAAQEAAAPSAQPVTKLKNGFYQDEKPGDFLSGRVTTFATPDDIASGQDNGVGSPHLGRLDTTQVAGVAIPQWVLQQYFGNSTAAMRQARVDVVDPTTGKRLRVPIVDIGPGGGPENAGVVADMTPALANYFGGDKNLSIKIVPKVGPDVMKNPQLFYDEQAAIKNGFDSSTLDPKRQVIAPAGARFASVAQTPEEAAAAQKTVQAAVQKQQDTLSDLQSKSTNMPDWYQTLSNPIPGVTDTVRNAVRDEYKKQITAYAQDYYKEPDPNKAFDRIMSAPNLLTSAGEIWTKAGANFQHAWLSLAQQADSPTQTKLIDFINAVQPNATPEARTALINEVMSKTAGKERTDFVNHLYNDAQAHNPDSVKNVNMYSLLDSIDVSAQPGMQAKEAANHARVTASVAQNIKDLRTDPTMENTYGGLISNAIAQMPKNVLEAITPVIGQSAMFSEVYTDTLAGLRKDHPDWSEDQVKAKAAVASLPQDALQELVNLATLGMGSGVTKGMTNPLARIATNAILHGTIAGGAGTAQQAVANVATGRPPAEGLPQAAATGFIQGAIGGAVAGRHPAEAERVTEPVTERPPERPTAEPPPPRPVTAAEVTGPEVADQTPWYKPGPIVTRAEQPETFSPSQLAEGVAGMRVGGSPEEMRQAAENLQPPADFGQRGVFMDSAAAQQDEIDRAQVAQAPQPTPEQQAQVDRANVVRGATGGSQVGAEEPWVSKIANRFTAERMATGELGQVEPGTGVTKEEMLARGLQMGPEEINQHISNLKNKVGGDPILQAAAVRAEEARLSQRSHDLSLISEANPQSSQAKIDAENAFHDLTDFHKGPVADLKSNWHAQGMTLQGEIPVDLSTYNGLREQFLKDTGNAPPASMEPVMRNTAKRVRDASAAETAAMNKLGAEIDRQSARRRLPSDEEVRMRIMERLKDMPCPT